MRINLLTNCVFIENMQKLRYHQILKLCKINLELGNSIFRFYINNDGCLANQSSCDYKNHKKRQQSSLYN